MEMSTKAGQSSSIAPSPAVAQTQVSDLGFQGIKQLSFTLESREGMVQPSQQHQSQPCSCNCVLKCVVHVKEGTFSSPHFFLSPLSLLPATLSQSLEATLKVTARVK